MSTDTASKKTLNNRRREVEAVRKFVGGGGDGGSLLAAEIRHMEAPVRQNVLVEAGVQMHDPPDNLGLKLKTECNLTWYTFRQLKK